MDDVIAIEPRKDGSIPHPFRIAVVSTPRSGNTWFRRLVATTYAIEEWEVHSPDEVDWARLSSRCILQLHWHRVEPFTSLLDRHQFRVVVLSRHPLDVLVSILHFAPHEPQTARWLEGEGGNEVPIFDVPPSSRAFLEYATGPRAAALLGVSHEWRQAIGCHCIRYEDLVRDPAAELRRLGEVLGRPAAPETIARAIAANSLENLRATSQNQHFWNGQPGLWKALIPAAEARRIARAHSTVFEGGGYQCDPDENLDHGRADANWFQLELQGLRRTLGETRARLAASQSTLCESQAQLIVSQSALGETQARLAASQSTLGETQAQLAASQSTLCESQAQLAALQKVLDETRMQLDATVARLAPLEDLGGTAIGVARWLRRLSRRFPRLTSVVRRLVRLRRRGACPLRTDRRTERRRSRSTRFRHRHSRSRRGTRMSVPAPPRGERSRFNLDQIVRADQNPAGQDPMSPAGKPEVFPWAQGQMPGPRKES